MNITISDVAWLYLLHYIYEGQLSKKSWETDTRMPGTTCGESLRKFDCVTDDSTFYESSKECVKIIDKYFGAKTFQDAVRKIQEFDEIYKQQGIMGYPIDRIPYGLFMKKNPNIAKAFSTMSNKVTDHYNSQRCSSLVISNLLKNRRLKEYNFENYFNEFPNEPKTFKLYRGIKTEFIEKFNKEGYSCWTTKENQAIRFAKYKFSGGRQFYPVYSDDPYILETEVSVEDVAIFIGGGEHEVILKNPVNIINIEKMEPGR